MISKLSAHLGPGSIFAVVLGLSITVDDIVNITNINPLAIDPTDVGAWNTWFDTATNADSPFTSVKVDGNTVTLFGCKNLRLPQMQFNSGNKSPDPYLISIDDAAGCIVSIEYATFANCGNLVSVNLPGLTQSVGYGYAFSECSSLVNVNMPNLETTVAGLFYYCTSLVSVDLPSLVTILQYDTFFGCTSLESVSLPVCTTLGASTDYNGHFYGITGKTFSLTVPPDLLICNGGNPDGDIQFLENNDNAVTIHVPTEITSFSPSTIYAPGGTVSISGKGFYAINSVTFGGVEATTYSIYGFTAIDAYIESALPGNIVIQGTYGSASKSGFVYDDPIKLYLDTSVTSSLNVNPAVAPKILILGDGNHNVLKFNLIDTFYNMGYSVPNIDSRQMSTSEMGNDLTTTNWDVVVLYTNGGDYGHPNLSTNLKSYVDMGGNLVTGTFLWNIAPSGFDFSITPFTFSNIQLNDGIGIINILQSHPILDGVTNLSGWTNGAVVLTTGATAIASFASTGNIAVAYKTLGSSRLVGINNFFGTAYTQIRQCVANSILWATNTPSATYSSINDLSVYGNDIQLFGGISQGTYSLIFDGTPRTYGTSSQFTFPHSNGFTAETWAKFSDFASRAVFSFNGNETDSSNQYINLQAMSGNVVRWEYFAGQSIFSSQTLSTDTWYHIVGVYDKSLNLASVYINGQIGATATYNLVPTVATASLKLGLHDNNMYGEISTLKLLNRPYTSQEVLDAYNSTSAQFI